MSTTLGRPTGKIASLSAGYVVMLVSPTGSARFGIKNIRRVMKAA